MIRTDHAELLEPDAAVIVGTVDGDGNPDSGRGWAPVLDGDQLVVLLDAGAEVAVANARAGRRIAVTSANVRNYRSVQLKGRVDAVEEPDDDDRERFRTHVDALLAAIHAMQQTPFEVLRRLVPSRVVRVTVTVEAVFDQTPGPTAGAAL